jgi:hypothetical protein
MLQGEDEKGGGGGTVVKSFKDQFQEITTLILDDDGE